MTGQMIEDYLAELGLIDDAGNVVTPETYTFDDDGTIPNSPLPVVLYRSITPGRGDLAEHLETLFDINAWPAQWRGNVFDYHHYHSVAHEVLGIFSGWARLRLGGEAGQDVEVKAGDVIILPAGTGHCCLDASDDFQLVAGYPPDQQQWDICRDATEHDAATKRIAQVPMPSRDPVGGEGGALIGLWHVR
ncbi:cupin domain-containing protein [Phytohalomonas tamaricis]|uniref:cupin domain-containing protein n=1 Tax=Phytohalomonas tamaricis TaxID=2081032 RepID=UPI0021D477B3|nr:cupin domain-containing protein [Phytohalomonas tamaricis]